MDRKKLFSPKKEDFNKSPFYSGWSLSWPVLITILGWIALLKGIAVMLFPHSLSHSFYRKYKASGIVMFSAIVSLLVGIILLYKSFMA